MIKPHESLAYIRPDEVAECWDGVTGDEGEAVDLYAALWSCVPHYKAPRPEVSEEPCIGMDSVKSFWSRFNEDQQEVLNQLAEANAY